VTSVLVLLEASRSINFFELGAKVSGPTKTRAVAIR
jgi:hypothetical protein